MEYCLENLKDNVAIIGDFNTGKHYIDEKKSIFLCADYISRMEDMGWIDGWRRFHNDKKEYTWYSSKGNGFRIDHIFCTPSFGKVLKNVVYSHQVREDKITDHSALIIDLDFC